MLDKESILQNAKFLAFPILNNATGEFRYNDSVAEAKYDWVCLPPEKMVYRGYDRKRRWYIVGMTEMLIISPQNIIGNSSYQPWKTCSILGIRNPTSEFVKTHSTRTVKFSI